MQEKSLIKKRILQYIDSKGLSKYEFYKKSGITRGILDQNTGISEDNIARFIAYDKKVNPEWLLIGEGPMFKSNLDDDSITEYEPPNNYESTIDEDQDVYYTEADLENYKMTIAALQKVISAQEKTIETLEKLVEPKTEGKVARKPTYSGTTGSK